MTGLAVSFAFAFAFAFAFGLGLLGCSADHAEATPPSDPAGDPAPADASADGQKIANLIADPGPVGTTVAAGAAIPAVHTWEVHAAADGYTVLGTNEAKTTEVALYFPLQANGHELTMTSFGVRLAPDVVQTLPEVLAALASDLEADPAAAHTATLHPLGGGLVTPVSIGNTSGNAACLVKQAGSGDTLQQYMAATKQVIQGVAILSAMGGFAAGVAVCRILF